MTSTRWTRNALGALRKQSGVALHEDVAATAAASGDFGQLTNGEAVAVASPRDIDELESVLRFANQHGLPITIRAGGNSQSGQSVPAHGLSLSTDRLDRVGQVDASSLELECESGARWRDVVAVAARHGALPAVMPLNLDLTVGGTLSAGGLGATSHRQSATVAHVRALGGVSGEGTRLRAGPGENTEFYHALLGGVGRAGVIASARLALRRVRPRVTTFFFHYDDLSRWLDDQRAIASDADYLEAFCAGSVMGLKKIAGRRVPFARWSFAMQASFEHDAERAPDEASVRARCAGGRLLHVEEDDTIEFAARYDARFAFMRRIGAWQLCHPWLEATIPLARAADLLPRVLEQLPLFLADGLRVNLLASGGLPPLFMVPEGELGLTLAILPAGVVPPLRDDAVAALTALHRLLVDAGGKRYLSGYLGMMDEAGWRQHFGARWDDWQAAKRRFDPNGVLRSALFP